MTRPFIYNAFVNLSPSHHSHGYWRTPEGQVQFKYQDLDTWVETAKTLERGKFDAIFFTAAAGVRDAYQNSPNAAIRNAVQFPQLDPSSIVSALAHATEHLGFALTSNIIQLHPFEFARRIASLDHLTQGRIAWNIVTSYLNNGARNFGFTQLTEHDERYIRADEYVDVVFKLLEGSWDDGAVLHDIEAGAYYDPEKVHRIRHEGTYYQVEGPHIVEPSPQRTPVLFQAGASESGRDFAAATAETTFLPSRTPEQAQNDLVDVRRRAALVGRAPEHIRAIVHLSPVIGSTEEEALRKRDYLKDNLSLEGLQVFYSGELGFDLSEIDPTTRLRDLRKSNANRGSLRAFIESSPHQDATLEELLRESVSGQLAGTPEQIADAIESWRPSGIAGFNVVPVTSLGWWDEFVDHVVPVLQRRGLLQREYATGTLRNKLFGQGDHLPDDHRARAYRGAFSE